MLQCGQGCSESSRAKPRCAFGSATEAGQSRATCYSDERLTALCAVGKALTDFATVCDDVVWPFGFAYDDHWCRACFRSGISQDSCRTCGVNCEAPDATEVSMRGDDRPAGLCGLSSECAFVACIGGGQDGLHVHMQQHPEFACKSFSAV